MRCRCGNEIKNVPEHLRDLAEWVCQECINNAPQTNRVGPTREMPPHRPNEANDRRKRAA